MKEGEAELQISVGAQDIVHITIAGDLIAPNLSKFTEWMFRVRQTIEDLFRKKNKRVLCLVDISELKKYDSEVLVELAALMKDNEPFVERTATFGGSSYMIMAEDVVVALSGRKNLKGFETKEKAMSWLLRGDD